MQQKNAILFSEPKAFFGWLAPEKASFGSLHQERLGLIDALSGL
jgi:hypothetical protein